MNTEIVKVEGMSCGHCKARVEKAVTEIDGVRSAEVDLQNQSVTVQTDGTVSIDSIKQAINEVGYKAV